VGKIETVLTKQGKTFKDYRHLTITEATEVCILNIIKGWLYPDRKTMNPTYEPYSTKRNGTTRVTFRKNWITHKPMSRQACS
jgi:hypothetical protein